MEKSLRSFISDNYTSKVYVKEAKTIAVRITLKESKGAGMINQLLLKSDSNAYTLQIILDKTIVYDSLYAFFATNSEHIDNVSAYTAGGKYYLTIQDLAFQKNYSIKILPTTSIVFDVVYIRYMIRDETYITEG